MPRVEFSTKAAHDLLRIYRYTAREFGHNQARSYKEGMQMSFDLLAANPEMGRQIGEVREDVRRHEHRAHIIFYKKTDEGIWVVRVLPNRSDWREHL